MTSALTLRELARRGVRFAPHEAVAIAQQLILSDDFGPEPVEPLGPPSLDTVELDADGSVVCRSSATAPAVFEIAILLDAMLPRGSAARGAGGLRYALARAFMEVDAPPFESIAEFSEVLSRYEQGDRATVLRALYARATESDSFQRADGGSALPRAVDGSPSRRITEESPLWSAVEGHPLPPAVSEEGASRRALAEKSASPPARVSKERRRRGPSITVLRRHLREADESLFRALQANRARPVDPTRVDVESAFANPWRSRKTTSDASDVSLEDQRLALPRESPVAPVSVVEPASPFAPALSREGESDPDVFVSEPLTIHEPLAGTVTETKRRTRTARGPLVAVAAVLLSTVAGYVAVHEYQRTGASRSGSAAGSPKQGSDSNALSTPGTSRANRATQPSLSESSANGSSVAIGNSASGGNSASADARNGQPAQLTQSASSELHPTSPTRALESGRSRTVASSSTARRAAVAPGVAASRWSARLPDVRSAVQTSDFGRDDLQVMTIADTGTKSYNLQPSPDGALVAFDSERDGERGVYIAHRSGDGVRRVSGTGFAAVPTWSPDSRTLAFLRTEVDRPHILNLWLLDLATGDMRRLTSFRSGETTAAAWFADGRRVAYAHDGRIMVRDIDDRSTRNVAGDRASREVQSRSMREYPSPIAGRSVKGLAVSPDGRHLVFQVAGSGAWLLDLQDGSTRRILTDPTVESFAWSADGRRIAYYSRRDDEWGVWIMAPQS